MKNFLILLFIFSISQNMIAQTGPAFTFYERDFKVENSYPVFGNNVKMRTAPSLDSEVVQLIAVGKEVKILEKTEATSDYQNFTNHWYKVEFENQSGYILGGLLAHHQLTSVQDKEVTFYYHLTPEQNDKDALLKIKAYRNKKLLNAFEFIPTGNTFSFEISDDRGVSQLWDILTINYWSEACGVEGGFTYIFWYENVMTHVADLSSFGDGGIYGISETFIFPNENEAYETYKSSILFKQEEEEMVDEDSMWIVTKMQSRKLEWNGAEKKIYPENFKVLPKRNE